MPSRVYDCLTKICERIEENKDLLTDLDREIGDADHGVNMARGFHAVAEKVPSDTEDIGAALKKTGMTLLSTVGGASGPLYGTAYMEAGKGVLLVIKNYTGDVMNFEMAADMAADEGIEVEKVVVADDVAVENSTWTTGRRGIAGTIFVHKLAGACAEAGGSLQEVKRVTEKVIANVRSMGMAVDACTVPAVGKPSFDLEEDEIEIGIGIHGEPGVNREKISPVNGIADTLLGKILAEGIYNAGDEVAVMVNGMGGTPLMELLVANKHVAEVLAQKGIRVSKTLVGNYMTSLDMEGFSLTLLKLDEELKALLNAPADTPAFVQA